VKPLKKKSSTRKIPDGCIVIGIDPGKSGGLVALHPNGKVVATPMPDTERDIWEWFVGIPTEANVIGTIELVHSMPQQSAQSGFTFGRGYGFLRACLYAANISFEDASPQTWLKALGIKSGTQKETGKAAWKKVLKGKAQQFYPSLPIWKEPKSVGKQLAISDALLIAEYCRRINFGGG
jgi:hypothetical protein